MLEIDNDFDICESDTLSMMSESMSKISIERLYSSHSEEKKWIVKLLKNAFGEVFTYNVVHIIQAHLHPQDILQNLDAIRHLYMEILVVFNAIQNTE
jgi:hypothetical protein